jgi:GNAT superfamily N-acetyltransferase
VVDGSPEARGLTGLGWHEVYVPTDVLVSRLSELLDRAPAHPRVEVAAELTPAWLAAYHRSRVAQVEPRILRQILTGKPPRAFAGVGDADRLFAIGRGHLAEDWLGLASLYTDPDHRRRGLATGVMAALGHWAARQGARSVYLQVAAENREAAQAYARLGFRRHHGYHYLAGPGS